MTTLVIYPSYTGRILKQGTSWAAAHDATTGTVSTTSGYAQIYAVTSSVWYIYRFGITFDTSAIPDDAVISSATLSLYCTTRNNQLGGMEIDIVNFSPASSTVYVSADYNDFGASPYVSKAYTDITVPAYNDFALDATGIAHISKTGYTIFGVRENHDTDNSAPTFIATSYNGVISQYKGQTYEPKLTVVYTTGTVHYAASTISIAHAMTGTNMLHRPITCTIPIALAMTAEPTVTGSTTLNASSLIPSALGMTGALSRTRTIASAIAVASTLTAAPGASNVFAHCVMDSASSIAATASTVWSMVATIPITFAMVGSQPPVRFAFDGVLFRYYPHRVSIRYDLEAAEHIVNTGDKVLAIDNDGRIVDITVYVDDQAILDAIAAKAGVLGDLDIENIVIEDCKLTRLDSPRVNDGLFEVSMTFEEEG